MYKFLLISSHRLGKTGFTLVELIIGMTIFAIGMTGIYALLSHTMTSAIYSRHEVVVANLLREQMELIKNIRDSNVRNFLSWDRVKLDGISQNTFASGVYIIENDYSSPVLKIDQKTGNIQASPVYMKNITTEFLASPDMTQYFEKTKLYLDPQGRYSHASSNEITPYASYIILTPMEFTDENGAHIQIKKDGTYQGYIVDARVIVHSQGIYREYDAKTAITDWIR